MKDLSVEAQVVYAGHWQLMSINEITFQRPWVISDKTIKGLTDLVNAGYLTLEKSDNKHSKAVTYKPTDKMKNEKAYYSVDFLQEHGRFPIIDESKENDNE